MTDTIVFYLLAALISFFGYRTVSTPNPIHCALNLVLSMITLGFMFFTLGAQFIGGVQLVVYAGAVLVLFLMVLMIFDLRGEIESYTRGAISGALKVASAAILAGLMIGVFRSDPLTSTKTQAPVSETIQETADVTLSLAKLLFTDYLLAFEVLGILLLMVAIGAVSISRMKGGTHASDQ